MVILIFCCDNWGSEKLSHLPRIAQLVVSEPGVNPRQSVPRACGLSLIMLPHYVPRTQLWLVGVTEWNEPWGHLPLISGEGEQI